MANLKTLTVYPSGYVSDDYAYASAENIENGYNSADNTTYATINLTTGSGAETYIYYTFDLSAIPDGAVITSVICSVKARISTTSSSYVSSRTMQLYSGTTAKGSSASIPSSARAIAITAGDWTLSELNDCRLRLHAKRGSSSTSKTRYISFYGATLTIEYVEVDIIPIVGNITVEGINKTLSGGYCNIDGVWRTICKSYSNINGVWKPTYRASEVTFTWKKYSVNVVDDVISYKFNTVYFYHYYVNVSEDITSWGNFYNDVLSKVDYLYGSRSLNSTTGVVTYSGTQDTISSKWSSLKTFRNHIEISYKYCQYNGYHYYLEGDTDSNNGDYVYVGKQEVQEVITAGEQTCGEYIEDVTSSNYNAYPDNGVQDGYWYVRQ